MKWPWHKCPPPVTRQAVVKVTGDYKDFTPITLSGLGDKATVTITTSDPEGNLTEHHIYIETEARQWP